VTYFFNIEYPRVGGNSNKISSDGAFVTRDVRSIVLGTVFHPRCERTNTPTATRALIRGFTNSYCYDFNQLHMRNKPLVRSSIPQYTQRKLLRKYQKVFLTRLHGFIKVSGCLVNINFWPSAANDVVLKSKRAREMHHNYYL